MCSLMHFLIHIHQCNIPDQGIHFHHFRRLTVPLPSQYQRQKGQYHPDFNHQLVLPFSEFHTNGIIQYELFCVYFTQCNDCEIYLLRVWHFLFYYQIIFHIMNMLHFVPVWGYNESNCYEHCYTKTFSRHIHFFEYTLRSETAELQGRHKFSYNEYCPSISQSGCNQFAPLPAIRVCYTINC